VRTAILIRPTDRYGGVSRHARLIERLWANAEKTEREKRLERYRGGQVVLIRKEKCFEFRTREAGTGSSFG